MKYGNTTLLTNANCAMCIDILRNLLALEYKDKTYMHLAAINAYVMIQKQCKSIVQS